MAIGTSCQQQSKVSYILEPFIILKEEEMYFMNVGVSSFNGTLTVHLRVITFLPTQYPLLCFTAVVIWHGWQKCMLKNSKG